MADSNMIQSPARPERGSSLMVQSSNRHSHPLPVDRSGSPARTRRSIDSNLSKPQQQQQQQQPPPPSRGVSGQKLGIFRKGTRGSRSTTPSPMPIEEDDDDEWLLEGSSANGHVNANVSVGREASSLSRSLDTLSLNDEPIVSSVTTAKEGQAQRRGSKGRSLAKKTSRLFQRSKDNSNTVQDEPPASSGSTLPIPQAGRQSSFSSVGSGETSVSRKFSLVRVGSRGSPKRPQFETQPSQPSSWHPPTSFPQRRASSSTQDSESSSTQGLPAHPLRHRQSGSHLSASVPTLNRHSAPPRPLGTGVGQPRQEAPGVGGRMSSWVSNIFSGNESSNNSPSSVLSDSTQLPPSPLRKGPSAAASFFNGVRNKAVGGMRYLLDSDAQPDQCQETMWVMGVGHPGWTPDEADTPGDATASPASPWVARVKESNGVQNSPPRQGLSSLFASSFNLAQQAEPSTPPTEHGKSRKDQLKEKQARWPEDFFDDFRSRVWCTYRSQYAPILTLPQYYLLPNPESYHSAFLTDSPLSTGGGLNQSRQSNGPWGWVKGDERGLTSDSGWGCMLRTGQSMLANALITVQLGRDWRLPRKPNLSPETPSEVAELEAYAKYVRILSWFLDDPSPLCPFSVHRMALIGKELGKEVGEWFGPSTASGALKTLANSFPICGLSVVTAVDGTVYRSDVYAASNMSSADWESKGKESRSRSTSVSPGTWGDKAVLILIGSRLGLDGVNPVYYDAIKTLFSFPQSVGIAGGRPSSSYYFVASQANSLFYLDPHFTRPAVPLRTPPASVNGTHNGGALPQESRESSQAGHGSPDLANGSDAGMPAGPLESPSDEPESTPTTPLPSSPTTPMKAPPRRSVSDDGDPNDEPQPPAPGLGSAIHSRTASVATRPSLPVDPQMAWYAQAYSEAQLQTFHCDRVKKLPLSGLDPSMLLGFLCTSEADFEDFCDRTSKLSGPGIFTVQDELPPPWSDDDDGALESVSEPVSGPEMSDDDSSEHNVSSVLGAAEVDEFGRITSRPASPGQTIGPRSTASSDHHSTVRTPRDEFEFVNTEKPFEPRPEVERNMTARLGNRESHSRSSSVDVLDARDAGTLQQDEEDVMEMLRPESSIISDSVDVKVVAPVRGSDGSELDHSSEAVGSEVEGGAGEK